jgi:GntR family transcriptional regulator
MSSHFKSDTVVPLYQQLYDAILGKIESGEYKHNQLIPSEQQLSDIYKVSRITVRSAIQRLADENILVKKRGKGTFVKPPSYVESISAGGSFTESCRQIGAVPGTKMIFRGFIPADAEIAQMLGVSVGSDVLFVKRLRLVDGLPAIFEEDYFHPRLDFLLQADLIGKSLLKVIGEHLGISSFKFDDLFEIVFASKEQAENLDCAVATPLLLVSQKAMTDRLVTVYYNRQYIRSDRYKYALRTF